MSGMTYALIAGVGSFRKVGEMGVKRQMVAMGMAMLAACALPQAAQAAPSLPPEAQCAEEAGKNERLYGIPARLLNSISVVESGRYDRDYKATLAWPWTVTSQGQGKYFPSKAEAIAEVRRLQSKGVKSIDVGCMQINLMYHPTAFTSLDEAFEPVANVGYAARFLKGLFGATDNWVTAASYYHSQTPHLAAAYRERLMKVWDGAGTQMAALAARPQPQMPSIKPGKGPGRGPSHARVEEQRKAWRDQQSTVQDEARVIAAAYRQARMSEYQMRRARMVEVRRAKGLSLDGY
jgi:hypothetical protein